MKSTNRAHRLETVLFVVAIAAFGGCSESVTGGDASTDATVTGMCPASPPTSTMCSTEGLRCGPYNVGHVDCFHPGQMTTGYSITATYTCSGGSWSMTMASSGSCGDS
jgi:hypothetical protein